MKNFQTTGEASSGKKNIYILKDEFYSLIFFFVGHLCPPVSPVPIEAGSSILYS
jgi:hypothetical protein